MQTIACNGQLMETWLTSVNRSLWFIFGTIDAGYNGASVAVTVWSFFKIQIFGPKKQRERERERERERRNDEAFQSSVLLSSQ